MKNINPVLGAIVEMGGRVLRGKANPGIYVSSNLTPYHDENRGSICPDWGHNNSVEKIDTCEGI